MRYQYEGSFRGDLQEIANLTRYLLFTLEHIEFDEDRLFDVRLILNELLINGFEHGNRRNRNKKIYLSLCADDMGLELSVTDEGTGIQNSSCNPYDMDCCSGRGLLLVQKLSDTVCIDQNRITAILETQK